jgi:hypothetical protein
LHAKTVQAEIIWLYLFYFKKHVRMCNSKYQQTPLKSKHCTFVQSCMQKNIIRIITESIFLVLTALLNAVQMARVWMGLTTHARHSPSWILFTS